MVGNDLIDLKQARLESNWQRKGYLDKICTAQEQLLIQHADDAERMLWLIWSMKEAAYKVINRITGIRTYEPLRLVTTLQDDGISACGEVNYQHHRLTVRAVITDDYIHAVAVQHSASFENLVTYQGPYTLAYAEAFSHFLPEYTLTKNKQGLPVVIHTASNQEHAASVSHHGRYLAVIYSGSLLSAG